MIGWLVLAQMAMGGVLFVRTLVLYRKLGIDCADVRASGQNGMLAESMAALLFSARRRLGGAALLGGHPLAYLFLPAGVRPYAAWLVTQLALLGVTVLLMQITARQDVERAVLAARADEARRQRRRHP